MSAEDELASDSPTIASMPVLGSLLGGAIDGLLGRNHFSAFKSDDWSGPDPVLGDIVELRTDPTGAGYEAVKIIGHRDEDPLLTSGYLDLPLDFGQGDVRFAQAPFQTYTGQLARPAAWVVTDDGQPSRVAYGLLGATVIRSRVFWGRSLSWWRYSFERPPYTTLPLLVSSPAPAPLTLTLLTAHEPGDAAVPVAGLASVAVTPQYVGPEELLLVDLPDDWRDAMADGDGGAIEFAPTGTTQGLTTIQVGERGSLAIY